MFRHLQVLYLALFVSKSTVAIVFFFKFIRIIDVVFIDKLGSFVVQAHELKTWSLFQLMTHVTCLQVYYHFFAYYRILFWFDNKVVYFKVHAVGGIVGGLLTGIFADNNVVEMAGGVPTGKGGWINGNVSLMLKCLTLPFYCLYAFTWLVCLWFTLLDSIFNCYGNWSAWLQEPVCLNMAKLQSPSYLFFSIVYKDGRLS